MSLDVEHALFYFYLYYFDQHIQCVLKNDDYRVKGYFCTSFIGISCFLDGDDTDLIKQEQQLSVPLHLISEL